MKIKTVLKRRLLEINIPNVCIRINPTNFLIFKDFLISLGIFNLHSSYNAQSFGDDYGAFIPFESYHELNKYSVHSYKYNTIDTIKRTYYEYKFDKILEVEYLLINN